MAERECLECGCVRGEYLCRVAEHLWGRVESFYQRSQRMGFDEKTWSDYQGALADYKAHFGRES